MGRRGQLQVQFGYPRLFMCLQGVGLGGKYLPWQPCRQMRCSATLALISLVTGNDASVQAARSVGLFEALVEQLDTGAESELACLTVMGLKSLGFRKQADQEFAVRTLSSMAGGKGGDEERRAQRVSVLQAIWSLESMASPSADPAAS